MAALQLLILGSAAGDELHARAEARAIRVTRAFADDADARPVLRVSGVVAESVHGVAQVQEFAVESAGSTDDVEVAVVVVVDERGTFVRLHVSGRLAPRRLV